MATAAQYAPQNPQQVQQQQVQQQQVQQQQQQVQQAHQHQQQQHDRRKKKKRSRKVGRWYLGETLGKGGYSWVKKGYDRKDGRVVALKFTSKGGNWSDAQSQQVKNEIEALRQIKHKHVLQLLAYNLNGKYPQKDGSVIPTVLLVLEYLPGGELFDILYYTQALKENIALTYFHQLMDGLEACHRTGICHRDIKPQNLLLDSHFRLKIADFGLAKVFEKDDDENVMRTFYVGTRGYQAPEILEQQPYTFACDIFSCGVVLFILLAGYPPFEAATSKCRWYAPLAVGNAREFWKQHKGCGIPSAAKDLITRMLWRDKDKRITIAGIKKHKWYNQPKLSSKEMVKELKTLHRKMEVERRNDASKQDQLHDSIKRPLEVVLFHLYPGGRPEDLEIPSNDDTLFNQRDEFGFVALYNGEELPSSSTKKGEILKVSYESPSKRMMIDLEYEINKEFFNSSSTNSFNTDDIESKLVAYFGSTKPGVAEIANADDSFVKIEYNIERSDCTPPLFPETDTISFKDIFTQCSPRFTLDYISGIINENGGETTIDYDDCQIEAKLSTHNFPAPVDIAVRVYRSEEYKSFIVRFDRISGDVLHFARVLKKLVGECGSVLTGISDEQYNANEKEVDFDDESDEMLNNFDIDGADDIDDDTKEDE